MKQFDNYCHKTFVLSVLLFLSSIAYSQPGSVFSNVGSSGGLLTGGADNPVLAVSKADNKMFLAYRDIANGNKLTVLQYSGVSWSILGTAGISIGAVNYSIGIATIATVNGNEVYVAFSDAANGNRLTIMRWAGLGWATDGTAGSHSSGDASSINMTTASNGDLFVTYSDLGSGSKAFVRKRVTGSWTNIAGTGISAAGAEDIDIACGNDNQPYIVYRDANASNKATVRKYNGTAWATVGNAGFTASTVSDCSIAVDRLNRPNISFSDGNASNKATVRYFDGTAWQVLGFAGFSSSSILYTSLIFDYDNNAYVIYRDNSVSNKATVKKYNGTTWSTVATTGFSTGIASYSSIEFDTDQSIYVTYKDAGVSDRAIVQQLTCNSAATPVITSSPAGFSFCAGGGVLLGTTPQTNTTFSWYQKINTNNEVGETTDLNDNSTNNSAAFSSTTDANGTIYVVKMLVSDSSIRVKRFTAGAWQDVGGSVGKSSGKLHNDATDIAFDPDGNLYVAYIDNAGAKPITLKKFVSGNWVNAGPAVSEACTGAALSINSYGVIALATGKLNGLNYNPIAYINDGSGWLSTNEINTDNVGYLDVCFDRFGSVIFGYTASANVYDLGIPKVYKYSNAAWTNLNLGMTANTYFITLANDANNTLYLATSNNTDRKAYLLRLLNGGTTWSNIGPTELINNGRVTSTMALDNEGVPYLLYARLISSTFAKLKVVKYIGGVWTDFTATLDDSGPTIESQLFFDNKNVPYLTNYYANNNVLQQGTVFQMEKVFLSNGASRYSAKAGDYYTVADAGCGSSVVAATVTVTQSSPTNNWTGAVSSEFSLGGNWSCGTGPSANDDVVISTGVPRYPLLSSTQSPNVSVRKLVIVSGASLGLNGQTINIGDSLLVEPGSAFGAPTGSKVVFNGTSGKQFIRGTSLTLNDVTISNASNVEAESAITIAGTLTFTNGKFIVGGRTSVGSFTGSNSNRYFVTNSGNVNRRISTTVPAGGTIFFPIGSSVTNYSPITVTNTNGSAASVSMQVNETSSVPFFNDPIKYVSQVWNLECTTANTFTLTPQWSIDAERASFLRTGCGIFTRTTGSVLEQNGIGNATTVSATTYSRTITGVAASASAKYIYVTSEASVLPIQLISFSAKLINNKSADIRWKITSSSNPKSFVIERSNDGILFENVGTINGSSLTDYLFTDNGIIKTGHQYYRLKMMDLDGKITYSKVAKVYVNGGSFTLVNIFPQPVKSGNVSVNINAPITGTMELVVTDMLGRQLIAKQVTLPQGLSTISIDISKLQNGVYFIKGKSGNLITNCLQIVIQ